MKICPICAKEYESGAMCPSDGATLIDKNVKDPLIGSVLKDTYRIDSRLAAGGMSMVYKATQISLNRPVVVKVLLPHMDADDFIQLFFREARTSSQINHPNVISIIDFGNTETGMVFLVMEYLEGETLKGFVSDQGIVLPQIVWIMEQICAGIHAAHQLDIVHRDLKPDNIFIARVSGNATVAKVLDFGISKPLQEADLNHTRMGIAMGTPGYLAPEQIEGQTRIDIRADIYALGAILYFMISGEKPYKGNTQEIVMNKQLREPPNTISAENVQDPPALCLLSVINKAMALNPDDRYQSVQALLDDIKSCVENQLDPTMLKGTSPLADAATAMATETALSIPLFQFVYSGETAEGKTSEEVKSLLIKTLKIPPKQCQKLFEGKRVVVKKNVPLEEAEKYKRLFDRVGALGKIEEMPEATRIQATNPRRGSPTHPSMPSDILTDHHKIENPSATPIPSDAISTPVPRMLYGDINQSLPNPTQSSIDNPVNARQQEYSSAPIHMMPSDNFQQTKKGNRRAKSFLIAVLGIFCISTVGFALIPDWRYYAHEKWQQIIGEQRIVRGVSPHRVRLGMSAAFSGGAREIGRAMKLGIETHLKEVNDAGGIHGRKIELLALDDSYEPVKAQSNLETLLDDDKGVLALIGNVGTPTSLQILPALLENRTLLFGTFSGASILRKSPPDRYVFNYRASYAEETSTIIHYFVESLNIAPERIGVFYQNDSFGMDGLRGVVTALKPYGVTKDSLITATYERNTAQVLNAVNHFMDNKQHVDAIVIISAYTASAQFTIKLKQRGFIGKYANVSFVGSKALAEMLMELGAQYGEDVIITHVVPPYTSFASGVLRYREALRKYSPNESPDFISLEGYIVAEIFCDALTRVGRTFDTEELINAMENTRALDLGIGSKISFAPSDHQASHQVWITKLTKDGQFEEIEMISK